MNKITEEYKNSKNPGENFAEWFLKRKLTFKGKMLVQLILYSICMPLFLNLQYSIFFLEFIFFISICLGIKIIFQKIMVLLKNKWS